MECSKAGENISATLAIFEVETPFMGGNRHSFRMLNGLDVIPFRRLGVEMRDTSYHSSGRHAKNLN
jgi:hypothetical protein